MDTSFNLNKAQSMKNEQKQAETTGTIASNAPSGSLFTTSSETAGTIASNTAPGAGGSSSGGFCANA